MHTHKYVWNIFKSVTLYWGEESAFPTHCCRAWSQVMWNYVNYSFTQCLSQAGALREELLFASSLMPCCCWSWAPSSEGQDKSCLQAVKLAAAVKNNNNNKRVSSEHLPKCLSQEYSMSRQFKSWLIFPSEQHRTETQDSGLQHCSNTFRKLKLRY